MYGVISMSHSFSSAPRGSAISLIALHGMSTSLQHLFSTRPTYDCIADADATRTAMIPSSRSSRRSQRDTLSINVIPDHLHDAEPQSPYLHWLFGGSSEDEVFSRLVDNELDEVDSGTRYRDTDAVVMKEVASWLELCEFDEFWAPRRRDSRVSPILRMSYRAVANGNGRISQQLVRYWRSSRILAQQ